MAKRVDCIVTAIIPEKHGFAVREDTDESVYLPHSVIDGADLEDFDRIEAVVVRSTKSEAAAPWVAIRARYIEEDAA